MVHEPAHEAHEVTPSTRGEAHEARRYTVTCRLLWLLVLVLVLVLLLLVLLLLLLLHACCCWLHHEPEPRTSTRFAHMTFVGAPVPGPGAQAASCGFCSRPRRGYGPTSHSMQRRVHALALPTRPHASHNTGGELPRCCHSVHTENFSPMRCTTVVPP